jgi:hypothetical protein
MPVVNFLDSQRLQYADLQKLPAFSQANLTRVDERSNLMRPLVPQRFVAILSRSAYIAPLIGKFECAARSVHRVEKVSLFDDANETTTLA